MEEEEEETHLCSWLEGQQTEEEGQSGIEGPPMARVQGELRLEQPWCLVRA